jgi:hypothetical protein
MTWLAPKLKERVEIQKAVQTPSDDTGGYDRTYQTLLTIWAGFEPVNKPDSTSDTGTSRYIRSQQTQTLSTHKFLIRKVAVRTLNTEFSAAFNEDFDIIYDFSNLKSEYFIFVKKSSSTKGRLFRINTIINVQENDEYFQLRTEQIEEKGTGYPA